jgi:DNA-binding response OmpR family regulator
MSRILVVEDDPYSAQLLFDLLSAHGYEVVVENNGLSAEQRADNEKFDLLILDLRLPEHNGFMVAEHIKHNQSSANIPIIVVSAYTARQNKLRAYQAGVDILLNKPIDTKELLLIISNKLIIRSK